MWRHYAWPPEHSRHPHMSKALMDAQAAATHLEGCDPRHAGVVLQLQVQHVAPLCLAAAGAALAVPLPISLPALLNLLVALLAVVLQRAGRVGNRLCLDVGQPSLDLHARHFQLSGRTIIALLPLYCSVRAG